MMRKRSGVERGTSAQRGKVSLYVLRSGPSSGTPDLQAAFKTKQRALDFAANLHGLDGDEVKRLSRELSLQLDRRWHGSELCVISAIAVTPEVAERVLAGELAEAV